MPATALIENANAGGDSAACGIIPGLVYRATFHLTTLPAEWLVGLHAREESDGLNRKLS